MKQSFYVLLLSAVVAAVAASQTTPVKKCKGTTGELFKQVVVSTPNGVCTKLPCDLISGKDVDVEITFEVRKEVQQITLKCNATALGITTHYPIPNATMGCDLLTNTVCPIEPDTEAELKFGMNVSKVFPKIPVDLVFYLVDQAHRMISCFEVNARVVNGRLFFFNSYF